MRTTLPYETPTAKSNLTTPDKRPASLVYGPDIGKATREA